MIEVTIDFSKFVRSLRKVEAEAPAVMRKVIDTDARGFVRDVVELTVGQLSISGKRKAEGKIQSDVRKAYGTASDIWRLIRDKEGQGAADNFWQYVKLKQWTKANKTALNIVGKQLISFDSGREHRKRRNPRTGRVVGGAQPKDKEVFIKPTAMGKMRSYTKKQQKMAGFLAAGFIPAAEKLKLKLPAWITRHKTPPGFVRPKITKSGYTLTVGNSASYARNANVPKHMKTALGYEKRRKRIVLALKYEVRSILKRQRLT